MAKEILTDAKVVIAGSDLGNRVRSVAINGTAELQETTGFGDTHRTYLVGYKAWTVTLEYYDDFADNDINEDFFSYWGTSQSIAITKADTTTAATNPTYSGFVLFTDMPILAANVGQVAGGSITLQGTGTLSRSVS